MDQIIPALWGLAAAAVTGVAVLLGLLIRAATPILVSAFQAWLTNQVQRRLGDGAARVAGEIAAEVAADPNQTVVTPEQLRDGVQRLRQRFRDTAGAQPPEVLEGMVRGELGRLGQAVPR